MKKFLKILGYIVKIFSPARCLLIAGFFCCTQTLQAQTSATPASNQLDAGRDWTQVQAGVPHGKIENFTIADKTYHRNRKIAVYTPPHYNAADKTPYRLLILFDGPSYLSDIPAPTILDNLLAAGKIEPMVAVMVDNSEARLGDLANHAAFANFVGNELVPWIRARWRVATAADQTILCGYSAGGLAAAYVAWKRPDLFGNVLAQSGAFWRGNEGGMDDLEWLTQQFKNAPKRNLRFYIEVGALETGQTRGGPVFIEANRRFRDALQAQGYKMHYLEVAGAKHEAAHWRLQLADGLIYLSGRPHEQHKP